MKGDFHQTKGTDGFYRIAAEGEKGNPGESGASAYEIWLSLGNKGTEEDFIKSLKGEKGDKGDNGVSGKWGDITGDISSQKDLQEALAGKADVATTLGGYGITDAYTKTEIDAKVSRVYHYKGTVSAYADLPSSGQEVGDVWNIETADSTHGIKAGDNVAWTGIAWDSLSGIVDLTPFALKAEAGTDHNHDGVYIPVSGSTTLPTKDFAIKFPYDEASADFRTGYLIGLDSNGYINIGGSGNTDQVILNANGLIFKLAYGPKRYASFQDVGNAERARLNFSTGIFNVETGFSEGEILLSDKYAAKSHTHSVSEISGLESMASGGVEEFSDASKQWSESDIGKIFIYKGLTQGKFINGRLYHCLKYTHVISSGASEAYLMLTLSQSTSEAFVNALAGRYDLTSGTVGTTNAVFTNSNGAEVYYNPTQSKWAIRYQTFTEAFVAQSGGPEGDYVCWDYETSVSITATKYETAGGDPVTEERYCAVIIDTSPVPIIESTGDLTVYPGISYKLNLSGDVTLSADGGVEGMGGECEIYISTSTYSVTAGTNITFVDTLFSNTTNHCVIKWDGESAKLYVCEVR